MHRDIKIGLSLGLLLVVVVAALFFRRTSDRSGAPPQLADAQSVDQRIAERERSPYSSGLNDFPEPPAAPPSRRGTPVISTAAPSDRNPVPGFLSADDGELHRRIVSGNQGSVPDPIPSSLGAVNTAPRLATPQVSDSLNGEQTHIIKKGDTLSGLAHKYLGDPNRFDEIYAANLSVLKNPNSLPEDVKIIIPPRQRPAQQQVARDTNAGVQLGGVETGDFPTSSRPSPTVSPPALEAPKPAASSSTTTVQPDSGKKKLFKPVRRYPFAAGRASVSDAGPIDRNEVP